MRRRRAATAGLALLAGAVALGAPRAEAYVRYKTSAQTGYYWPGSCAAVTIYLDGFDMLPPNQVAKAVSAAAHTWSPAAVTCADTGGGPTHPYLEIVPTLSAQPGTPPFGNDARNSVIFRNDSWSHVGDALALTTVTTKGDGRIIDADIEINAFALPFMAVWANLDPGAPPPPNARDAYDLQNTLTHEFGHFIGLDHTCFAGDPSMQPPLDDSGQPVPDCPGPQAVQDTVMYPYNDTFEVKRRVLSPDEIRAVCEIYPPRLDLGTCALDQLNDGCGCVTGRGPPSGRAPRLATACLALLALAARRPRWRTQIPQE